MRNTKNVQLEIFMNSLPARPYCADYPIFGTKIRPAEQAVKEKLIQPNHPDSIRWMAYDLDSPTARLDYQDLNAPPPNIMVVNRENGHAHALYGIENPVHIRHGKKSARNHPLRYAGAIDVSLTGKLQADPCYSKTLVKNPLHEYWETITPRVIPYDLSELADWLDLSEFQDLRKNLPAIGLGRNCTLFDNVKKWAYTAIREEWINFDFWMYTVNSKAETYNNFNIPLPSSEVRSTAKSVGKWVWNNMSPEGWHKWAENRRKASKVKRGRQSQEKAKEALYLRQKGKKQAEIAKILGINQSQVSRLLNR